MNGRKPLIQCAQVFERTDLGRRQQDPNEYQEDMMQDFKDKVAVITGGGRGIGRGLALHCAKEGMKVVLAGIGMASLSKTAAELQALGTEVLAVQTDVAKAEDLERLAQKTVERFGAVHLLINNAGVGGGSTTWGSTLADWEWVFGVNVWGVIHGLRSFVPIMLEQSEPSHIVNVSSISGLITHAGGGVYRATKHTVVAISETLFFELADKTDKVKVSVFCPAGVQTDIGTANRNRPATLQNDPTYQPEILPESAKTGAIIRKEVAEGQMPEQVAAFVFQAIREERFYILSHPEKNAAIRLRMEDILQGRDPQNSIVALQQP